MSIFIANKQLEFGVGLKEIETMTPQQAYLFEIELNKAAKELEQINGRN